MRKLKYDELDDIIFELNDAPCSDPSMVNGPIANKTFLWHMGIGLAIYILVPLGIIAICYLVGH